MLFFLFSYSFFLLFYSRLFFLFMFVILIFKKFFFFWMNNLIIHIFRLDIFWKVWILWIPKILYWMIQSIYIYWLCRVYIILYIYHQLVGYPRVFERKNWPILFSLILSVLVRLVRGTISFFFYSLFILSMCEWTQKIKCYW